MRSDHWNFLANLLGTPGPAEPPKKEKEKSARAAARDVQGEVEEESERSQSLQVDKTTPVAAESGELPSEADFKRTPSHPPAGDSQAVDVDEAAAPDSVMEVIEALTSAVVPQQLPGFGPANRAKDAKLEELTSSADRPSRPVRSSEPSAQPRGGTDSDSTRPAAEAKVASEVPQTPLPPENDGFEQTWGQLASELGVSSEPKPHPEVTSGESSVSDVSQSPRRPGHSQASASFGGGKQHPPRKTRAGGFGSGLGFDLDDDDDDDEEEVLEDVEFAPQARSSSAGDLEDEDLEDGDLEDGDLEDGGDDDLEDDLFSSRNLFAEVGDDDEDDSSEGGIAFGGERSPRDRDQSSRRSRGRQRGRERSSERPREEVKEEGSRSAPTQRDEDEGTAEFGGSRQGRTEPSSDRDDSEANRRRRGRRGARQRASQPREEIDSTSERTPVRADARSREETSGRQERRDSRRGRAVSWDDDAGGPSGGRAVAGRAEFEDDFVDDDLEREDVVAASDAEGADDGDEADDARRPRRRRRRGRGRGARETREPQVRREEAEGDTLSDDPIPTSAFDDDHEDDEEVAEIRRVRRSRSRGDEPAAEAGGRRSSRESVDERDDRGDKPKRREVPTWLETVEVLVNANIENHKRSGRGGGGGGGGGGRGRGGKRRS